MHWARNWRSQIVAMEASATSTFLWRPSLFESAFGKKCFRSARRTCQQLFAAVRSIRFTQFVHHRHYGYYENRVENQSSTRIRRMQCGESIEQHVSICASISRHCRAIICVKLFESIYKSGLVSHSILVLKVLTASICCNTRSMNYKSCTLLTRLAQQQRRHTCLPECCMCNIGTRTSLGWFWIESRV
jgi:hypothetical protein